MTNELIVESHTCHDCQRKFTPIRDWQKFCSDLCRIRSHRRKVRDIDAHHANTSNAEGKESNT